MASLVVLWLTFTVVAWNLASGDLTWYLIFFGSVVGILCVFQEEPWIRGLLGYVPQAVVGMLILSLLVTFVIAYPETIFLLLVPCLSLYFAWGEVSYISSPFYAPSLIGKFMILLITILLGLGFGKFVDLTLLPHSF